MTRALPTDISRSWTEDEIAAFEARRAIGTRPRLAFDLLLYTAQRRSDVLRMGRQHVVTDDLISVQQDKTGTKLMIPINPMLRLSLAFGAAYQYDLLNH